MFPKFRELEEQAVQMALQGRWEEAERLNRLLLERDPRNVDALNRLGKALMELHRYDEAYAAYGRALELDPYNRIARKNRERLSQLLAQAEGETPLERAEREQIRPDLFIAESGKSAIVSLHGPVPPHILRRLSRGQHVRLEASGENVLVKTEEGKTLGRLEVRTGRRLAEFIRMGNRYAAAIAELGGGEVKLFIRETYQHPSLAGRLSFPPLTALQAEGMRPYLRDLSLLEEVFVARLEEEEEEGEEVEEEEGFGEEEIPLEEGEEELEEESLEEAAEEEFDEELGEEF